MSLLEHTERQKMLAGEPYDPLNPEARGGPRATRDLCQALTHSRNRYPAFTTVRM
ncbi:MAG: hypothetical protein H0T50_06205 [Gemmatimonadales bacterium]|nr:hypothetical protein [Gemmatimonadales bacterium]